ncbi:MAG: helix-hairpin-helix domain-containing protein [candidate division WOR-3 bacterium]|uniref:Helix-hairpin-helix domain-containing protein n=1 Tax=candidate division WOR-3 bacterium TaxID=2052148 RepID=A0A7C1X3P5_UNCW3|nr:helix-hairpin-helix domain-containing protein [candidate division WOR-3 bacterium]
MNEREKTVLIFLSAVLLIGAVINVFKSWQLRHRLASLPLELKRATSVPADTVIDINSATAEQLEALPGIGPVLAQRIVSYREKHGAFKDIAEICNVSGIGPKKFAALKEFITCKQVRDDESRPQFTEQTGDATIRRKGIKTR